MLNIPNHDSGLNGVKLPHSEALLIYCSASRGDNPDSQTWLAGGMRSVGSTQSFK